MQSRETYGFQTTDKRFMHQTFQDQCMYPEGCEEKNDRHVHHLSGCYVSSLKGLDPEPIKDVTQNGLLLCPEHRDQLDSQERLHISEIKMGLENPPIEVEPVWVDENRAAVFLPNEGTIIFER